MYKLIKSTRYREWKIAKYSISWSLLWFNWTNESICKSLLLLSPNNEHLIPFPWLKVSIHNLTWGLLSSYDPTASSKFGFIFVRMSTRVSYARLTTSFRISIGNPSGDNWIYIWFGRNTFNVSAAFFFQIIWLSNWKRSSLFRTMVNSRIPLISFVRTQNELWRR